MRIRVYVCIETCGQVYIYNVCLCKLLCCAALQAGQRTGKIDCVMIAPVLPLRVVVESTLTALTWLRQCLSS